ncbi:MAG: hypothetical protein GF381_03460 [Candidatus Pacebacteria bacterium]|nr:hypothetical protein [Candidatus Paceibacterota bacterium]
MYYSETRRYLRDYNPKQTTVMAITGTKGKTSVSSLASHVLRPSYEHLLLLNTVGVYWDEEKLFSHQDSVDNFGKAITVMPGRYFYGVFRDQDVDPQQVAAVMETALGTGVYGTGLTHHSIGVLTNIFQDHIDGEIIRSRDDIYQLKSFIFKEIRPGGLFVTNADQDLCLRAIQEAQTLNSDLIIKAFTRQGKDHAKLMAKRYSLADVYYFEDKVIHSLNEGQLYDISTFPYFFEAMGAHFIAENIMAVMAALSVVIPLDRIAKRLNNFRFPFEYGRLQFYHSQEKRLVVDFAHEIESLTQMIDLIKNQFKAKPAVVTRIAPDRSDDFIQAFAQDLAKLDIQALYVFDIIDGKKRKIFRSRTGQIRQPGDTVELIASTLAQSNPSFPVYQFIDEARALDAALDREKLILHIKKDLSKIAALAKQHNLERYL